MITSYIHVLLMYLRNAFYCVLYLVLCGRDICGGGDCMHYMYIIHKRMLGYTLCFTVSEEDVVPGYWSLPGTVSVVPIHRTIHGLQARGKVLPRKVRCQVHVQCHVIPLV